MRKKLKLPKFKNEGQERDFWAKINLAEYFDALDFDKVSCPNLRLKPLVKRRLDRLMREAKAGKNLSPAFSDVEDAIHYLNR